MEENTADRQPRVVLAGNILLDVVKQVDVWPEQGHLATILGQRRACGGSVCNTGVFLKTLDPSFEVCACGKVGSDDYGDWLCAFLSKKGLDISRVRRTDAAPTSFTDVMSVVGTGERTFFHARGANALFTPDDIDLDALGCDLFHLGYLLLLDGLDAPNDEYGTVAARLLHDVQERGIPTSVDLVSEQSDRFVRIVRPALKYCDHLVVNEFEGFLRGSAAYSRGAVRAGSAPQRDAALPGDGRDLDGGRHVRGRRVAGAAARLDQWRGGRGGCVLRWDAPLYRDGRSPCGRSCARIGVRRREPRHARLRLRRVATRGNTRASCAV